MMREMRSVVLFAVLAFFVGGCGSSTRDPLALGPTVDAGSGDVAVDAPSTIVVDAGDDGAILGAPCTDDPQCDDKVACTFDTCDPALHRCRNVTDDSRCDDGIYCNGAEKCVAAHGCTGGAVVTCEDADACTIDRCVEASKSCDHAPRDVDGDGDPDDHCVAKHDCDDLDPAVASTHVEVCANGKDDNCDGKIDEQPCSSPANDICGNALAIGAPGTYAMTTVAAKRDYPASCGVGIPSAGVDVVAAITIPAGAPKDLVVWGSVQTGEIAIAFQAACGDPTSELACSSGSGASILPARARSLGPGTYFAIITTQTPTAVELQVDLLDATTKPANETCANAAPIAVDVATPVSIVDAAKDLAGACFSGTGELTYALTLTEASDVRVFATTVHGSGTPVVGLRNAHCVDATDELHCRVGTTHPLFARNLAAGTWILTVAATTAIDASIVVKTAPATIAPPNQTCAAPPTLVSGTTIPVDLSNQEDAIKDGCYPGAPDAAYDFSIANTSDVLVVGRFPQIEVGAISIDHPTCAVADVITCAVSSTPVRVSKRALDPGDYRVVIADTNGAQNTLSTYIRDTVPPTAIAGSDTCASSVFDITGEGGFFTGDTTTATADFDDSCDTPTPPGGANDQILRMVLTQPQHVILNMDGSTYATILDVRAGTTCPGIEVANACYVGFNAARSFLDLPLPADTYWIVVDGFNGAKGPWNLDVRILPP